ncbi:transmembrane protein 92-like [Apodemus sylvaticus]|uniref:transmembrane protein 92-like n=1 Tax=Apodemus sylvaticus TaxID=10129 RepID=UPI002241A51C|nr:transmembrane protein 92-like [Apodemus sylvaticus]
MKDACAVGTLTLIFGLLCTLQGVNTNEGVNTCDSLSCPKGFICCDNICCPERKVWTSINEPFRFLLFVLLIMVALLCIYGLLLECFSSNCGIEQHDIRTEDHQTTTEPPFTAPLESIWVVLNPTPTEPPPPYSLRPEGPAGQMRGNAYATL